MDLDKDLDFIIQNFEGSEFVDHPDDRGGPTKFGITKKALSGFLGRSVSTNEIHELTLTLARKVYVDRYAKPVRANDLQSPRRLAGVDYAIHSGPVKAIKAIQEIVKVAPDGILGPVTWAAIQKNDPRGLCAKLMGERLVFLTRLVSRDRTQAEFIYGWGKRLAKILETV